MKLQLPLKDITEATQRIIRTAFRTVQDTLNAHVLFRSDFRFIEITVGAAVTGEQYQHNLPFVPKDVIGLSVVGAGAVTWNYVDFNETYVNFTTTDACVIRAFIGRYQETP